MAFIHKIYKVLTKPLHEVARWWKECNVLETYGWRLSTFNSLVVAALAQKL